MRILCGMVFVVVLVALCQGNTNSINATHPDYPGICFFQLTAYSPGEFENPIGCGRFVCSPNGWLSAHNCIKGSIEGCIRGERVDRKKPFPDCCLHTYICKHGDGSEYTITDF